jgi:cytoskeletal protein CcmA (bactofilin family)
MADTGQQYGTIIGADASFKGEIAFESSAKLLGRIEGSISSKGRLHIADGSTCKATVTAKEVAIEGAVEGNVEASELLELKPTARVKGDVVAARMTMVDGASIDGYCRIGLNGKAPAQAGRSAATTEVKGAAQAQHKEHETAKSR